MQVVKESDDNWQPCGNFRWLKLVTEPDQHSLPRMDNLSARLNDFKIISKLDLKLKYHQIPISAANLRKTVNLTPFSLFEYMRMPFGLLK